MRDPAVRNQPVPAALATARPLGEREITTDAPWVIDEQQQLSLGTDFTPERVGETNGTVDWYLYGTRANPGDAPYFAGQRHRLWYINYSSQAGTGGRAGPYRWACTALRWDQNRPVVTVAVDRLPDEASDPVRHEGPIASGQVVTRWLSTAGVTEHHFAEGPGQRGSVMLVLSVAHNVGVGVGSGDWQPMLSVSMGIPGGVGPEGNASLMHLNPAGPEYQPTAHALDTTIEVLRTEFSRGAHFRPGTQTVEAPGPLLDMHVLVAVTRRGGT